MSHLTSCLLMCLISAINYVAAQPIALKHSDMAPNGWSPRGAPGPQGSVQVLGPRSFNRGPVQNLLPGNPGAGSHGPAQGSQMPQSAVNPRAFRLEFQVPTSNNENDNDGHNQRQSQFQLGTNSGSQSHAHPQKKPGFHLSFALPVSTTTTAAPTLPPSNINAVNAEFSFSGPDKTFFHSQIKVPDIDKPVDPTPAPQKPQQSKFVSFIHNLLQQKEQGVQTNTQGQQNKVVFHQLHGQSGSFQTTPSPNNVWMANVHVAGSTDTVRDARTPDHQDARKDILQSVQYLNGQLMIPLDKCPGFEKYAESLKGYYHGHKHHHGSPYYVPHKYQHGYTPGPTVLPTTDPPQQTTVQAWRPYTRPHKLPPHIHQHGQGYQHWLPPHLHKYVQSSQNVKSTVPSPTAPPQTTVQPWGPIIYQNKPPPPILQHGHPSQGYPHWLPPHLRKYVQTSLKTTVPSPTAPPQTTVQPWGPVIYQHTLPHILQQTPPPHGHPSYGHLPPHWLPPHLRKYVQTSLKSTVPTPTAPPKTTVQPWGPVIYQQTLPPHTLQHGYTPFQHGYTPYQHGYTPYQHGYTPYQHGYTKYQHGYTPYQHGYVHQHGRPSHGQGYYQGLQTKPDYIWNPDGTEAPTTTGSPQFWRYPDGPARGWPNLPRGPRPVNKELEEEQELGTIYLVQPRANVGSAKPSSQSQSSFFDESERLN